jgi:hypothetical protein
VKRAPAGKQKEDGRSDRRRPGRQLLPALRAEAHRHTQGKHRPRRSGPAQYASQPALFDTVFTECDQEQARAESQFCEPAPPRPDAAHVLHIGMHANGGCSQGTAKPQPILCITSEETAKTP